MTTPLNVGRTVEHGGKTYTLRELDEEARGVFETWLVDRVEAEAARAYLNPDLPDGYAKMKAAAVAADVAAGLYDWGSEACVKAITRSRSGGAYAIHLMLRQDHPEVDELTARAIYDAMVKDRLAKLIQEHALDPPGSAAPAGSSPPGPPSTPGSPTTPETSAPGRSPG